MIIPLGGGGSKVVASIVVTYPTGSTLTCTLGSKVLTAKDTSGKWVFGLPSIGDWVVNATKGSQSKSKTISITTEDQSVSVTLSYRYYLFKEGEGVADNWGVAGNATLVKKDNNAIVIKSTEGYGGNNNHKAYIRADLSEYTTLKAEIKTTVANKAIVGVFGTTEPTTYTGLSSSTSAVTKNVREVVSLDISSFSGNRYVGIHVGSLETLTMYNFWLE